MKVTLLNKSKVSARPILPKVSSRCLRLPRIVSPSEAIKGEFVVFEADAKRRASTSRSRILSTPFGAIGG